MIALDIIARLIGLKLINHNHFIIYSLSFPCYNTFQNHSYDEKFEAHIKYILSQTEISGFDQYSLFSKVKLHYNSENLQ